jgi:DNA-binding XRE family transcriptional regulator
MTRPLAAGATPTWTLADRLRKSREYAGLTQHDLAETIGVAQRSISAYEGGARVKRPVVLAWALACGVDLGWLTEEPPSELLTRHGPKFPCLSDARVIIGPWPEIVTTLTKPNAA